MTSIKLFYKSTLYIGFVLKLFYACYGLLNTNTNAAMRWSVVPEKISFSYAVFSADVPQVLGVGERTWVNVPAVF